MWVYSQKNGKLFHNDTLVGIGYAGAFGPTQNNPDAQCLIKLGPLPRGLYMIGPAYVHPHLGPVTMNLTPDLANDMCDPPRAFFRIHPDSVAAPGHGSEGCICMARAIRVQVDSSTDKRLQVIAEKN